jgi:hypothetical protein
LRHPAPSIQSLAAWAAAAVASRATEMQRVIIDTFIIYFLSSFMVFKAKNP